VINRRINDPEYLQENYQIQNSDKTLAKPPLENHVTNQQSPWRQILEVARQKERATRRHVPEAQDTFLSSNERGRQESRQSTHS
jgi:hypothetical protein